MTQRKIACVLAEGFEDSEFKVPYDRLRAKGFTVDVIGAKQGQMLKGKAGKQTAKVDRGIDEASVVDYLGLLIPGGKSPGLLAEDSRFVDFVREFSESKKPVAAICHGPQLLLAAGLVKGRKLTAFSSVQGELREAGAKVSDEPVVSDENWITSRKPDDIPQFCEAIELQFDTNADQSWMSRGDVHPQA